MLEHELRAPGAQGCRGTGAQGTPGALAGWLGILYGGVAINLRFNPGLGQNLGV